MKIKALILFMFLLDFNRVSYSQIDATKIAQIIEESFDQSPVKGLAVSVVNEDHVVLSKVIGKNLENKLKENSPLWIGSVSKTMTALGICRLVDLEKLNFNDPIIKYLPEKERTSKHSNITIKDLLHHHSGFSQQSGYTKDVEFNGHFSKLRPVAPPGEKGIYSSTNYALLGAIIEYVAELPYAQFMKEQVFEPLGMFNTFVPTPEEGRPMEGYCLYFGFPKKSRQMDYGEFIIPAGYIVSTLNDINQYTKFLLGNGEVYHSGRNEQFLRKETLNDLFTTYKNTKYGYGKSWGIGQIEGIKTYSHEGMTKISNAQITLLPEQKIAVNVMTNTNSGPFFSISSQITNRIVSNISMKEATNKVFGEYLVRIIIGLMCCKMIYNLLLNSYRWSRKKYPIKPKFKANKLPSYIFEILPFVILLILPKLINVPISMLLRIMPDIGFSILLGGIVSIILLFFKLVLAENNKLTHRSD